MGLGSIRGARLVAASAGAFFLSTAAYAETLTIKDLAAPSGATYTMSIPTIEIVDGNITEAKVRALASGDYATAGDDLSHLSATKVTIPEIAVTYKVPGPAATMVESHVTYRDFVIEGVANGVARKATLGSSEVEGAGDVSVDFGAMSITDFDLGALLAFYGIGEKTASEEFRTVYSGVDFAGAHLTGPKFACDVGPVEVAEFKARPLKHGILDLVPLGEELQKRSALHLDPTPEQLSAILGFYADLLTAFDTAPMQFGGLTCKVTNDRGEPVDIAVGSVSAGGWKSGVYPASTINDVRIDAPGQGFVHMKSATLKAIDFSSAVAAVLSANGKIDPVWLQANYRRLIPAFGGFSVTGLSGDVPGEHGGPRSTFSYDLLDFTLGHYINGIPADIAVTVDGLKAPVSPELGDAFTTGLIAAGITELRLDMGAGIHWDEASRTIVLDHFLFDSPDLGRIALSGTIGNATPDLFSDSPPTIQRAVLGLTVKNLTLELEDRGLMTLLMQNAARGSGQPEGAFRIGLTAMTQGVTIAYLGASPESLKTATALATFLGGAPNLKVTLVAKDDAGIGLADFEAAQRDPSQLAAKMTVTAEASGTPAAAAPPPPAEPAAPAADTNAPAGDAMSPTQSDKAGAKSN